MVEHRADFGTDEDGADFKIWGIDVCTDSGGTHMNQIEVYGSEGLRDYILNFLQKSPYDGEVENEV